MEEEKDYSKDILEKCREAKMSEAETLDIFYDKYNTAISIIRKIIGQTEASEFSIDGGKYKN